ncbi:hypothetical protein [Spiroplasma endosymbiont of Nebria brevicollis]|uniref:hypothetical protein n=1 Tax=Spiroplasma endosymbiont of Nebria brevicollis TaxID=3066284 RepID=UPI00313B4BE6
MLIPITLAWIAFSIHLINCGLVLCEKNNPFGILLLTISLNIIGTFIGCMIIYKKQNPEFKFWKNIKLKKKNKRRYFIKWECLKE